MTQYPRFNNVLRVLLVAAMYFVLARLSLLLQFQNSNATPVWPPSGFAFAVLLLLGYRIAPGIFLGAFAANLVVFLSNKSCGLPTATLVSSIIGIGNTGEALAGYFLIKKILPAVRDNNYFQKVKHLFWFLYVAVLIGLVSCTTGAAIVYFAGIISPEHFFQAWFTWWIGDVSGILLFTPLLLIWATSNARDKKFTIPAYYVKTAALLLITILCSGIIFDDWFFSSVVLNWAFWIIPVLVWAAFSFQQREAITAIAIACIISIWGTINGHGPFEGVSLNQTLLIVQGFVSIIVMTMLALNTSVMSSERSLNSLHKLHNQLEERIKERTSQLQQEKDFVVKANEQTKQSEERFRGLLDSAPDATVIVNDRGKIVLVNFLTEKLFGYTREELLGQYVEILIPERFSQRHPSHREKYFSAPKVRDMGAGLDLFAKRKDGTEFPVEISLSPLHTEEGTWVSSSIRDITQRRQAEESLKESEARIQSIFRSAPDAVIVFDTNRKITAWNPMAETIFGWRTEEVIGKYLHEIIIPVRLREAHKMGLVNYPETGEGRIIDQTIEMLALHKSGKEFYVSLSISQTPMKGGTFFTVFASNITEFKKAQEEIKQKTAELERSNKELEQFAYAASHDLQEPLRSVIAYLQIIERRYENKLDPEGKEFIERAVNSADRMRTLINDLLVYSRVSRAAKEFGQVDCRFILNVVCDNLYKSILENKAVISFAADMPVVAGDDLQLTLLFQNLISNAIKFKGKEQTQIHIAAEDKNSHWQFSVKDNGIGIPADQVERIFILFQRLHTREEYPGTGIGLAVCKKIVENHGGKIWVESEEGKGSAFYFTVRK